MPGYSGVAEKRERDEMVSCLHPRDEVLRPDWRRRRHSKKSGYGKYSERRSQAAVQAKRTATRDVAILFHRLADEWTRATGPISSVDDRISHPAYREIVNLGWEVVPHLIDDLPRTHRFWFPALAEITRIQPFDQKDAGNIRRMTKAWTQWWEKRREMI